VASLASVTDPRATLHVLCLSDIGPPDRRPHPVSEDELRAAFGPGSGWTVTAVRPERIETTFATLGYPAWLARVERR
jgi:hypothetical protein